MLARLEERLQEKRLSLERDRGSRSTLLEILSNNRERIKKNKVDIELYEECILLLDKVSKAARTATLLKIESVVRLALQHVFGFDYDFSLVLDTKGGSPTVNFFVISNIDGRKVSLDPRDSKGGGVSDVVGLALRLSLLELYQPKIEGPLILDEPCSRVDINRSYLVAEFLKLYSERIGRQVILITHQPAFVEASHKSFTFTLDKSGITKIE